MKSWRPIWQPKNLCRARQINFIRVITIFSANMMTSFFSFLSTALLTLVVFGLLIFVHELGHFLVAKAMGVKVNEFSMGMGPALFKFTKKDTKYSIRLFPIGGFVNMEGEQEYSEHEGSFHKKPVWRRILIIISGSLMNILLGFLILTIYFSSFKVLPTTAIAAFDNDSVSSEHLQVGDKIVSIDGTKIIYFRDIGYCIYRAKDEYYDFEVIRNGKKVLLEGVKLPSKVNADGTKSVAIDFMLSSTSKNPLSVVKYAALNTISIVRMVWLTLIDLLTGNVGLKAMAGPVGVAGEIGKAANMGIQQLMLLVSFMAVNLGVFNLLPVPALDGGHLVFLVIEGVTRKPIKPEYAGIVQLIGFALLILLIITVTFNDIARLVSGG